MTRPTPSLLASIALVCALPLALAPSASAQDGGASAEDLSELSLEELMEVEVSVASRRKESLTDAPAAVYVITGEELRRAGFTSVQEALRMVPGFEVEHWASNYWSVTARGFSGPFSTHLLVMIDGVNVATPQYAGVFWDTLNVDLADVERIELIRGPGATLWGQNAVNGVIHVITRRAAETQGFQTVALVGEHERAVAVRYGAQLDEGSWYRVWARGADFDPQVDSAGDESDEERGIASGGFRWDRDLDPRTSFKLIGDAYTASVEESYFITSLTPPFGFVETDHTPKLGGKLLASWERDDGEGQSTRWQGWWWNESYKQVDFREFTNVYDLEWTRRRKWGQVDTLFYGAGLHVVDSKLDGDFTYDFDPKERSIPTLRLFVQNEHRIPERNLRLILGAQVQDDDVGGPQVQPTARAVWQPREDHTVWAAVSRAVRNPGLDELDQVYTLPVGGGNFIVITGSDDFVPEELVSFEAGWRMQASEALSVDVAAFYNRYDNVVTQEDGTPFTVGANTFFPIVYDNQGEAESYGLEVAADWEVSERWRLRSAYTLFSGHNDAAGGSTDPSFEDSDEASPPNQFNVRSYYDLGREWELDAGLYYVDHLVYWDNPAYWRGDLRVGYNPSPGLQFSIGVQNAFDGQHPEQGEDQVGYGSEVERNVYFSLIWRR